jgi:hypothetical protein
MPTVGNFPVFELLDLQGLYQQEADLSTVQKKSRPSIFGNTGQEEVALGKPDSKLNFGDGFC